MGWADWLFAVIIACMLVKGLFAGLIHEAIGLVSIILAYMIASVLYSPLGEAFAVDVAGFNVSGPVAFIMVFVGVLVGFYFLERLLTKLIDATLAGWVNHLSGAALGLLKGVLVCAAIVLMIHRLPSGSETRRALSEGPVSRPVSAFAKPLAGLVEALAPVVEDDSWWRPGLEETLGVHDGEWELLEDK
ncbi:CvpA family protein [bacterium]|nr:CvpA family protein [bacterium]